MIVNHLLSLNITFIEYETNNRCITRGKKKNDKEEFKVTNYK